MSSTQMFVSGTCATLVSSTASHASVEAGAQFDWNATFMPHEEGVEPMNSTIGGAALWVIDGKSDEEYAAAAAFLDYVASTENQVWWSEQTGYVPVTTAAYEQMVANGYFEEYPTREIAILQLSRGEPNENSRGFRFGNHNQTSAILIEEIEAIFTGQKSVQEALDSSVSRGNDILRQYEQLHAGQ
jgi:sn-glycerol 3-phosphate transport system substrate-binding protein